MLLKYFYNEKLAHASYLVGCQATGEAIIIDPGRHVELYLETAEANDMRIVAVTETHIHADFVSGARELAERTGAKLYLSDEGDENWKYQYLDGYDHELVYDGSRFSIGNIHFQVMHTPGHTPEHISFLLTDGAAGDKPMGIFTGDFVFVGSIGRPDLLEKAAGIMGTAEAGARQMFRSVQRFKQLPDYLQVWPGHGAGSACGKGLGAVPSSTVGYEKMFNPMLQIEDEEEFVRALLEGQPESPKYFAVMKRVNKEGPAVLGGLPVAPLLGANRLPELVQQGAQVIDTRPPGEFAEGHFPGTINIPMDYLAAWAGWLVDYDRPYYLIVDSDHLAEALGDLIYIGLDQVAGYFEPQALDVLVDAGFDLECYDVATPEEIADAIQKQEVLLVDVRNESEWAEERIPGAIHTMLGYLPDQADRLIDSKPIVVQCRTGGRSAIAASLLQARGAKKVINLAGGILRWEHVGLPVERG